MELLVLTMNLRAIFLLKTKFFHLMAEKVTLKRIGGKSMPSAWIWTQSNTFEDRSSNSFMLSVANIPWLGKSLTGFLGFLYVNGEL